MIRSHEPCWDGEEYAHICQEPTGKACIVCGGRAGTWWGSYWCPDCDVLRLDGHRETIRQILIDIDRNRI